jgi:hypothetical protein
MLSKPLHDLIRLIRVRCNIQHEFYNKIIVTIQVDVGAMFRILITLIPKQLGCLESILL